MLSKIMNLFVNSPRKLSCLDRLPLPQLRADTNLVDREEVKRIKADSEDTQLDLHRTTRLCVGNIR